MKKIISLSLMVLVLSFASAGWAKDIKAAFVYVGPVGDGGWIYAHDQGRQAMEILPFVKKTTYIESVPDGAEATRVIMGLASKGYNLIFTTSFGFMDPTLEVAKRFPDVAFEHCSGYKTSSNMGNYFGRYYQGKYLSGIIAGAMTKSNIIGYVGADVLSMHQDTPATLQAAEARGAFAIGNDSDMRQYAPKAFLTAPIWDWGVLYKQLATQVHDGTWKAESIWWGMETGIVKLAPISDKVPQKIKDLVAEKQNALMEHKMQVFTGPIKGQDGKVLLVAGKTFNDKELLSMNFFIEGVQETIPE